MKATIDVPEELYRRVKAKSALEGKAVREVTAKLFQLYVDGGIGGVGGRPLRSPGEAADTSEDVDSVPSWFAISAKHLNPDASHNWSAIRESIDRAWASEVAEAPPTTPKETRRRR